MSKEITLAELNMKEKERFFWGCPTTLRALQDYKDAVEGRYDDEKSGKYVAMQRIDAALDKVTNKSTGLLQAVSVLAAIASLKAFPADANQLAEWPAKVNSVGLALALFSCILLSFNLSVVWARHPTAVYANSDKAFMFTMNIYKWRARRFTLALVLSALAFFAALLSVAVPILGLR
jgi:hypothetical protein